MSKRISGLVFVLGDDIDTDQIIPAPYLVYSLDKPGEREQYGRHALSAVPAAASGLPGGHMPFVAPGADRSRYGIIIAGRNFGCGSSREHAPAALQIAGVQAVVAQSYARIFYRNAVDGGFLVPLESETDLTCSFHTGDRAEIDLTSGTIKLASSGESYTLKKLGQVKDIVEADGLFAYARKTGMIGDGQHA